MKKIKFSKSEAESIRKASIKLLKSCNIIDNNFVVKKSGKVLRVIPIGMVNEQGVRVDSGALASKSTVWKFDTHYKVNFYIPELLFSENELGKVIIANWMGELSNKDCEDYIYNLANEKIRDFYSKGNKIYAL